MNVSTEPLETVKGPRVKGTQGIGTRAHTPGPTRGRTLKMRGTNHQQKSSQKGETKTSDTRFGRPGRDIRGVDQTRSEHLGQANPQAPIHLEYEGMERLPG